MLNTIKHLLYGLSETRQQAKTSYQQTPSISTKLPWMDYDPKTECFCLEDGRSVAAVFELADVSMDSQSEEDITTLPLQG